MKFTIGQQVWVLKEKICQGKCTAKIIKVTVIEYFKKGSWYRLEGYYPYSKSWPTFTFKTENEICGSKEEAMRRWAEYI